MKNHVLFVVVFFISLASFFAIFLPSLYFLFLFFNFFIFLFFLINLFISGIYFGNLGCRPVGDGVAIVVVLNLKWRRRARRGTGRREAAVRVGWGCNGGRRVLRARGRGWG